MRHFEICGEEDFTVAFASCVHSPSVQSVNLSSLCWLLPSVYWYEQWRYRWARTLTELCSLSAGPAPGQTAAQTSQRISLRDRLLPSPKTSISGRKGACNIELGFATETYFYQQRSVPFLFPGSSDEPRKSLKPTPLKEFCFLRNYKGLGEDVDPRFHP